MIEYTLNLDRIEYLIKYYHITKERFLAILNGGIKSAKNMLSFEDLQNSIPLARIKKIDAFFEKGLHWYIDEEPIQEIPNASIFFRKNQFNSSLSPEDIKIIDKFENKRILTQVLYSNAGLQLTRKIKRYTTNDPIDNVVAEVKRIFEQIEDARVKINYHNTKEQDKKYLKYLCNTLEHFGVLIFEYLENHNKKEKVQFEGLYLTNIIVIKRLKNTRREIFTLLHEFAHFLLDTEEIDEQVEKTEHQEILTIEKWCNRFAFEFLIHQQKEKFHSLNPSLGNNFCQTEIIAITDQTFINPIACYLNLYYHDKITAQEYQSKKREIEINYQKKLAAQKRKHKLEQELKKAQGEKIPLQIPKAIQSKRFEEIITINFDNNIISDVEYCNYLGLSAKKRDKFFEELCQ